MFTGTGRGKVCVCVCARFVILQVMAGCVWALSVSELFPFGTHTGDKQLEPGSDRTGHLDLQVPIIFYSGEFDTVHINTNGFISTTEPTEESEYLGNMPASFGMLAALLGDTDTSDGVGKVYYRQDSLPETLRRAADHINHAFPNSGGVQPSGAVVATWEKVAAHGLSHRGDGLHGKRNTFQIVVASTQTDSYAILLYPRDELHFLSTSVDGVDVVLEAGFSKGLVKGWIPWTTTQGPYYRVTGTNEASVRKLSEETNSGQRGVWVFHIGATSSFLDVGPGEVTDVLHKELRVGQEDADEEAMGEEEEAETPTQNQRAEEENMRKLNESEVFPPPVPQLESTHAPVQKPTEQPSETLHTVQPHYPEASQHQYRPDGLPVVVVDEGDIGVDVFSYNYETCANSRHECSPFSYCTDYTSGYCCHCTPGYYGNGKHCLAEGKPQRVNGKVSGRLFVGNSPTPLILHNNDLHSYVVANDGRAYVAISAIPNSVGASLLPLACMGGVIGWAFALERPGFENGFRVVGGEFTRQADVTFLPGNEKLTIKQYFKGIDEHDHLVVNTELEGDVPEVPPDTNVQINHYTEIYQYSSTIITSSSTREYTLTLPNGTSHNRSYQWRQTITYQGCAHDESTRSTPATQQLSVDQIYVLYDASNQLIRYATTNKIGSMHSEEPQKNPCFTDRHRCDTNAVCRPGYGDQYSCECVKGFNGDGRTCYDIDECSENPVICGAYSVCNNQPGAFHCQCLDGYQYGRDGKTCVEAERPVDHCRRNTHNCDIPERARCIYTEGSLYVCLCLPGYEGDGRHCRDIDECQAGQCHQDAVCFNTEGSFTCMCKPDFRGDGTHCSPRSGHAQTACQRHRENALSASATFGPRGPRPVPGHFVPVCDAVGNYEPTQCHANLDKCWCVDRKGQEIPGTRAGAGNMTMCLNQTVFPTAVGPTPRPDVSPPAPGAYLLFAQSGKIEHVPLDGSKLRKSEAKALLHIPDKVVIGVAYDCVERMVYWTDITGPSISKASTQGGDPVAVITTDLESPEGITIDHLGRNMFWTDSMRDVIEVSSLDGTQRLVLFDTDLVNPRAIIADPTNGYLYWADWNRDAPKIEVSYLDGTNRRVLVSEDLSLPNGLTFDPQASLLCWADAGTHKVECMNPGQNNRRMVMGEVHYPFALISYGRHLYYTDWRRDAVIAVDRPGQKETDEFHPQKHSRLYGITVAQSQCPSGQNYCSVNGCTHLCLATPTGHSCVCPDNAVGADCGKSTP